VLQLKANTGMGIILSTHEQIMEVYEEDIASKSRLVESTFGKSPFYDHFDGFRFGSLFENAGIEKIVCSEYRPRELKWSNKYGKSLGEKA
jgi:hypothetical protein